MKDYKKVIAERYDRQRYDGSGIKRNIYSPINPIGFYGEFKSAQILSDFIELLTCRAPIDKIKICDCGCGDGVKTRMMAELLCNPEQVYGLEFSKNRLQHCEKMNGCIHYKYSDLTEKNNGIPFDIQFDAITAFVVFTHFRKEQEIKNALENIYHSLKKRGFFLWYEICVSSHWEGKRKNVDSWGFSSDEMDFYASEAGFRLVNEFGIYSRIPVLNKPTCYLAKSKQNIWLLELLERMPFKKNNMIKIYCKE